MLLCLVLIITLPISCSGTFVNMHSLHRFHTSDVRLDPRTSILNLKLFRHLLLSQFSFRIFCYTHRTAGFSPQSRVQLKGAVDACLKLSPKGECFDGPHGPIAAWDVSRVSDMSRIFAHAKFSMAICRSGTCRARRI